VAECNQTTLDNSGVNKTCVTDHEEIQTAL